MHDVKIQKWWPIIGVAVFGAALAAGLSGCGSNGDSSDTASVRVANITLTHPSLDLLANSSPALSGTALDTVSGFTSTANNTVLQLNDSGSGTALATTTPTLTNGDHYTLMAYESGGAVKILVLNEDLAAPITGTAQLRVFDAALDAGRLDVYITDPATDLATVTAPTVSIIPGTNPTSPGFATYSAGTYRIRVTGGGNKSDLRLDMPAVVLTSQEVVTIALTPASGGILLNGSSIVQQGAYAAVRNTNARVRLAAAVAGGATVSASAGNIVIDSGSVAPAFGFYTLVPASTGFNISVNGQSIGGPATALTAGSDATLLVYGSAASPAASLIADDNRLPTDPTTAKLRLINGITGKVGPLTLTANSAPVGAGVAPGAASGYVAIPIGITAVNLSLTSSLAGGTLLTNSTNPIVANTTYSVLAGGDFGSPEFLIR